jgi:hypothetical protein
MQFTADLEACAQRVQFIDRAQRHQDWRTGHRSGTGLAARTLLSNLGSIGRVVGRRRLEAGPQAEDEM